MQVYVHRSTLYFLTFIVRDSVPLIAQPKVLNHEINKPIEIIPYVFIEMEENLQPLKLISKTVLLTYEQCIATVNPERDRLKQH